MAINNSPVITDDITDYPEESVENEEDEIDDYLDQLERETWGNDSEFDSENEKSSGEITPKVDLEVPGNIFDLPYAHPYKLRLVCFFTPFSTVFIG